MVAALAKSEIHASHAAGVGKVRERTIVLGPQVIAIENIGSIRIVEGQRNWLLALLGLLVGGGAATQVPAYGSLAWVVVGVGGLLVLVNLLLPVERGLSIGTSDGRITMIVSKDVSFLRRLLDLLVEKINSKNEATVASFDIASGALYGSEDGIVFRDTAAPRLATSFLAAGDQPGDGKPAGQAVAATETPPVASPVRSAADEDEALFSNEAEPPLKPRPAPEPAPLRVKGVSSIPERSRSHDPMLDGPSISAPLPADDGERDWLKAPGRIVYGSEQSAPPRAMRWAGPVLLLALLAGGAAAAWTVFGQPGGGAVITLLSSPGPAGPAETVSLSDAVEESPAPAPVEAAPSEFIPAPPPAAEASETLPAAATTVAAVPDPSAVTEFTPPEPMVSRASGQRYRSRPSSADDVPVVAETRAGGEALQVNGRSIQPDGEWYRVALQDGRSAWFKASLAVSRARFAEIFATPAGNPSLSFAATAPRILEPAEGVQLSGGPQPVRLAWSGPEDAAIYIVEIEAFDPVAQRWISDAPPRRVTVEAASEVAEAFSPNGAWRWRVRGVSASGDQSQFSRWSAFGIRD